MSVYRTIGPLVNENVGQGDFRSIVRVYISHYEKFKYFHLTSHLPLKYHCMIDLFYNCVSNPMIDLFYNCVSNLYNFECFCGQFLLIKHKIVSLLFFQCYLLKPFLAHLSRRLTR